MTELETNARFEFVGGMLDSLRSELASAMKMKNPQLYRIVQALIWIGEGESVAEVAGRFRITCKTVYNWIWEFATRKFSWLAWHHFQGRGRKSKLSVRQKQELYKMIVEVPGKNGFNCGGWNSAMIADMIFSRFGVNFNPRYLCALLGKIGLSFQKAKFVSDKVGGEEYESARTEWKEKTWPSILKAAREKNAVIMFGDEASFAMWGSLSRTWAPLGKQPVLKTTGRRKGLKMFGAIEFQSGKFIFMETPEKFNSDSYLQFLRHLLDSNRAPIILIEDGAPYHRSSQVKEFQKSMEDKGLLFTYRLPSFSPDFNPIEKLWRNTKRNATHLKYFKTFDDLRESVLAAFEKYMSDAAEVIRVMKKLRSLAELQLLVDSFSEK